MSVVFPLLAIDPGKRALGWAVFTNEALHSAGVARSDAKDTAQVASEMVQQMGEGGIATLVVEQMRVYPGPQQKGDQNDLIDLAYISGGIHTLYRHSLVSHRLVPARAWKGQVPKDIMEQRIRRSLTGTEVALVEASIQTVPPSLRHNAWDAVGLGLSVCGRLR